MIERMNNSLAKGGRSICGKKQQGLLEYHNRKDRFIASTLFHEFVPNRRLTGVGWFGYLWVRGKASREDAL